MRTLFDATRIGTLELKNRLVRSATWEGMADENGWPTPRLIEVYKELAVGGIGLIISSAAIIEKNATILDGMLSIATDASRSAYQELVGAAHGAGCPIVMQLGFVGRQGERWTPERPSHDDLKSIAMAFGYAAERARRAGFDGVQIHSGHGYFLSQFLSSKNTRTDHYGGSVENRTRFLSEIYGAIRSTTGDSFNILVKINCSDFDGDDGVWHACLAACKTLAHRGLNAIEITGGVSGTPPRSLAYDESVFRDYAAKVAETVDVPVILVGLNRSPQVLRTLLETTKIECFSLSRPLLRQPHLPRVWKDHPDESAQCQSCDSCREQDGGNYCPFL